MISSRYDRVNVGYICITKEFTVIFLKIYNLKCLNKKLF